MLCPHCSATLADAPDLAGQSVSCPHCHGEFVYHEPPQSTVNASPPVLDFKPTRSTPNRHRPARRENYGLWIFVGMLALIVGELIAGLILDEIRLARIKHAMEEAQQQTAKEVENFQRQLEQLNP